MQPVVVSGLCPGNGKVIWGIVLVIIAIVFLIVIIYYYVTGNSLSNAWWWVLWLVLIIGAIAGIWLIAAGRAQNAVIPGCGYGVPGCMPPQAPPLAGGVLVAQPSAEQLAFAQQQQAAGAAAQAVANQQAATAQRQAIEQSYLQQATNQQLGALQLQQQRVLQNAAASSQAIAAGAQPIYYGPARPI